MKNVISITFIFICFSFFSQSKKERYADKLYNNKNYYEASFVYRELVDKDREDSKFDYFKLSKLADSYYRIREYTGSLAVYELMYQKHLLYKVDLTNYVDCLLRLKNRVRAVDICKEFEDSISNDRYFSLVESKKSLKNDSLYSIVNYLDQLNSGEGDFSPFVKDKKIYFASSRKDIGFTNGKYSWDNTNFVKIYSAEISSNGFENVEIDKRFSTKYHDGVVSISPNGNRMFVTSNDLFERRDKLTQNLIVREFLFVNNEWILQPLLKFNNENYSCGHVAFINDSTIIVSSNKPGGYGLSDLYKSTLTTDGWGDLINLGSIINTTGNEMFPYVSNKGTLYFSSNGHYGFGGLDIYRSSLDFINVENVGAPVNSEMDDFSLVLDRTESNGYFTSDRLFVDNLYSVYFKEKNAFLLTSLFDKSRNEPSYADDVFLVNGLDTVKLNTTDENKYFSTLDLNKEYEIIVQKEDYYVQNGTLKFNTTGTIGNDTIPIKIDLNSDYRLVKLHTIDKISKEKVSDVNGFFIDPNTNDRIAFLSDENGDTEVKIKVNTLYASKASKKGFLDLNSAVYIGELAKLEVEMSLEKIKKNVKFEIKNVLYDFAKSSLRDESTLELDKLVEFLKVNNTIKVELSSHTDCRGSDADNLLLSQRRAESCVNYLISKGIVPAMIVAKGYGEKQLLNKCDDGVSCSEEEHQVNRRTEIKILSVE